MAVVYWIRKKEHSDMFSEGYVGVSSKSVEHRFQQHKADTQRGSAYPIHKAIRKYGDELVIETLVVGSTEYCYDVEKSLRPLPSTGWNINIGGVIAPMTGRKHSEDTRKQMSVSRKASDSPWQQPGRKHSEETKAKMSAALMGQKFTEDHKSRMRVPKCGNPWDRTMANKDMWKLAHDVFLMFQADPSLTSYKIRQQLAISLKTGAGILKKLTLGWIPSEDKSWLDFKTN